MTARVIVLGGQGFVGGAIANSVSAAGVEVIRLSRSDMDLAATTTVLKLSTMCTPEDLVVFAAAEAPCKTMDELRQNLAMTLNVIDALRARPPTYLLNISSDAVYLDSETPLTESSPTGPSNLHGAMHAAREHLLEAAGCPVMHLRPTLIYGKGDPHNGYGPNQFISRARSGRPIEIFGRGEERRDHVHIQDVAAVAVHCLSHRLRGRLNVASGETTSFRQIADHVVSLHDGGVEILERPRSGPMPHGGYRPIAIDELRNQMPTFQPLNVLDGVRMEVHQYGQ